MHMRSMVRTIAKWTATAATLTLLSAWLLAGYSTTSVLIRPGTTRPHQAVLSHGSIEWLVAQPAGSSNLIGCFQLKSEVGPTFDPGLVRPRVEPAQLPGIDKCIIIPLWIPLAMCLAATPVLWFVDRRRRRPGYCAKCGYDLTKNLSGRCPECGSATPAGYSRTSPSAKAISHTSNRETGCP